MNTFVLSEQNTSGERLSANKTIVRFFASMCSNVLQQGVTFHIGSAAFIAFVRFFHTMTFHVALECAVRKERLVTQFALHCLFALVVATMLVQSGKCAEAIVTDLADIWFNRSMRFGVLHETWVVDRGKTAYIAG